MFIHYSVRTALVAWQDACATESGHKRAKRGEDGSAFSRPVRAPTLIPVPPSRVGMRDAPCRGARYALACAFSRRARVRMVLLFGFGVPLASGTPKPFGSGMDVARGNRL